MSKQLYESFYINFSSSVPRPLLEELAQVSIQSNSYTCVSQVYDQYLNYVCLESDLFTLQMKDTYFLLNDSHSSESILEELTQSIVSCLFSVIITMNVIPIIRCQRGGVSEMVASKLDLKLRDHLMNSRHNIPLMDNLTLSRPRNIFLL